MRKFFTIVLGVLFISASLSFGETDYVAMPVIKDIQQGADNANKIQNLRAVDAVIEDDATIGGDATVDGTLTADLDGLSFEILSVVNVTNTQIITLEAGKVNVLKSTGGAANSSNTCTLANFATADIGKSTWIVCPYVMSNYLYFAASTNWYGAEVSLNAGEGIEIIPTAAGVFYHAK